MYVEYEVINPATGEPYNLLRRFTKTIPAALQEALLTYVNSYYITYKTAKFVGNDLVCERKFSKHEGIGHEMNTGIECMLTGWAAGQPPLTPYCIEYQHQKFRSKVWAKDWNAMDKRQKQDTIDEGEAALNKFVKRVAVKEWFTTRSAAFDRVEALMKIANDAFYADNPDTIIFAQNLGIPSSHIGFYPHLESHF